MTDLPPNQNPNRPYRIATVCLGNICRSPMAEAVLTAALEDAGLIDRVEAASSGTGRWPTGDPMDDRAATTLAAHGYDPTRHRAQRFDASWYDEHDLILTMDSSNHRDVRALAPSPADADRVRMYRAYDPEASRDDDEVPDPWYGGPEGFERVLTTIERTTKALVDDLEVSL